jgi:hypothetical protein
MEQQSTTSKHKSEEILKTKIYSFSSPEDVIEHPDAPQRLIKFWTALQEGTRIVSRS